LNGADDPGQWSRLATGWADLGFRYDEAVARFHLAESLLADVGGRSVAARRAAAAELVSARRAAAELGAAPLLARVDDLACRARLGSELAAETGTDRLSSVEGLGLTQRERTVLELLARGHSNGQIGEELFISTKTASVHVSNILRKLGVRNRVEAAAFAATHHPGAR
jgi:DNA-binding NarL/FixJ family response regulator